MFKNSSKTLQISLNFKLVPRFFAIVLWALNVDKSLASQFTRFQKDILHIWKESGPKFLVSYLKSCTILIHHYLSGKPTISDSAPRVATKRGLPLLIPGPLRLLIESRDVRIIRAVLSLLSMYRVIRVPCLLKLETITGSFSGLSSTLPVFEIKNVKDGFFKDFRATLKPFKNLKIIRSAGPNNSVSSLGSILDAFALSKTPSLLVHFKVFSDYLGGGLYELLVHEMSLLTRYKFRGELPVLGRLEVKEEAAGKARVFAITDYWTQNLLLPLHDYLFDIIRQIPMDGTFDQAAPLKRLQTIIRSRDNKYVASFDLSAATDRLPLDFQVQVLSQYFNTEVSLAWASLLRDRYWFLNLSWFDKLGPGMRHPGIQYSVGQPMGAYSSWGMLALSHHYLVQIAANRVGITPFTDYALLGDDIVIANESVAQAYLVIMKTLGVEINLSKSIISDIGVFEFAKRLLSPTDEFSPVGSKLVTWCIKSPSLIANLFLDLTNKGVHLDHTLVTELFQIHPFFIGKVSMDKIMWTILGPFGFITHSTNVSSSMKILPTLTNVRLNSLINSIDQVKFERDLKDWELALAKAMKDIKVPIRWLHEMGFIPPSPNYLVVDGSGIPTPYTDVTFPSVLSQKVTLLDNVTTLLESKPVRRFIFDAPLGFSFYVPGSLERIIKYIENKCKSETVIPITGISSDNTFDMPVISVKGIKFFNRVRVVERQADLCRRPNAYVVN